MEPEAPTAPEKRRMTHQEIAEMMRDDAHILAQNDLFNLPFIETQDPEYDPEMPQ